jgi:hypothetical protein
MKRVLIGLAAMITFMVYVTSCGSGSDGPVVTPPPPPPPPVVCVHTLLWVNPTENTDGQALDVDELKKASLYVFRIPMAQPEEVVATHEFDPYILTWILNDVQVGQYYYRLTVWNNDAGENLQESDFSNEVTKTCP